MLFAIPTIAAVTTFTKQYELLKKIAVHLTLFLKIFFGSHFKVNEQTREGIEQANYFNSLSSNHALDPRPSRV